MIMTGELKVFYRYYLKSYDVPRMIIYCVSLLSEMRTTVLNVNFERFHLTTNIIKSGL